MPVIKSPNVPAAAASFSMRDIENAAKAMLLRARERAEALLAEAQREAEALKAEAHAVGLAEGRRDGLAQGKQEGAKAGAAQALAEQKAQLTAAFTTLTKAAAEFDASRRELEADGLTEVIQLATAVARRVTKRQGMLDPAVLTENLKEAMRLVAHAADVRVAIHPSQKVVLDAALPSLRLTYPDLKHVALIEDPGLAPGGCRILTARGQVDADLDAQLDRVVADLLPTPGDVADTDAAAGGEA